MNITEYRLTTKIELHISRYENMLTLWSNGRKGTYLVDDVWKTVSLLGK